METNLRKINKIRLDVLNKIRSNANYRKQTKLCQMMFGIVTLLIIYIYSNQYLYLRVLKSPDFIPESKIPRIVHQIWIGSPISDLPEYKKMFMDSFKTKMGKHWKYMLWTHANLTKQNFNLTWKYQQMAKKAAEKSGLNNFAMIADLMRYEIVYKYGGFYADTNMELFRPMDSFLNETFVIAHEDGMPKRDYCSIGFFGGIKHHPALEALLQKDVLEKRNYSMWDVNWQTGPGLFGPFVHNRNDITILDSNLIYPTFQSQGWMAINLTKQDKCISINQSDGWKEVKAKDQRTYFWKFPCDEYPDSIMADHFAFGASWG